MYVHFPGTYDDAAFFSCNDAVWLGRVHPKDVLDRSAYEFYTGTGADGNPTWSPDDQVAEPVFEFELGTSVQQVSYHPYYARFIFANWAWIDWSGYPKPDHTTPRTERQRTQLTLVEGPTPWGPWSTFYRNDDWQGSDGSRGAYTPVFPPAWIDAKAGKDLWIVSTQCCGTPQFGADNHYDFTMQQVLTSRPSQ